MNLLGRIIVLPFKVVAAAMAAAFQAGRLVGSVPVGAARRTSRLLGFRGTFALLVGFALGLLLAPVPGRQLRARLRAILAGTTAVSDAELAERVSFELEHAPRTWHLPQPQVSVASGRVVLSGDIDHEAARDELARVAAAVPGVAAVDNLVVVTTGADPVADPGAGPA